MFYYDTTYREQKSSRSVSKHKEVIECHIVVMIVVYHPSFHMIQNIELNIQFIIIKNSEKT
jgi:hypothetical protein